MADLIEYNQPGFVQQNRGYRYILCVIDIFSKMAYTRAIKKKSKFDMSLALDSIFSDLNYFPNTLITDEGLEFYNKDVQKVLLKYGMHHYSIKTKMKASVVERLNRTLKMRLERYFYQNKTKKWIDVLDQMTRNYNVTPHRSIGMTPKQVNDDNAKIIFDRLYPDINLPVIPRLAVGNLVRILKEKTMFEKGYKQNWSEEVYQIRKVKTVAGRVWYKISDLSGNKILGIKYYFELNLVANNDSQYNADGEKRSGKIPKHTA